MNIFQSALRAVAACAVLTILPATFGQQPVLLADATFDGSSDSASTAAPASSAAAVAPVLMPQPTHPLTERWLDLTTLSHAERFRSAIAEGGVHDFQNAQTRSLIEGKFKIDPAGNYAIGFRASSGRYFNWAFSNYTGTGFVSRISDTNHPTFTPAELTEVVYAGMVDPAGNALLADGIQSNGWEFYMRELYLSATPVKPLTVEFGSMAIERGYSTEITTFDDDGYISGERVRLHDKHLFFDEVSFTNGFFGDFATVNLFERGSSLENFNYRQLAAKKRLNDHVSFSGEYTWQTGLSTLREAAVVNTKSSKVIDSARVEVYERTNSITFAGAPTSPLGPIPSLTVHGAPGFAVAVAKKVGRLNGDLGFASVDKDYTVYANSRFVHAVAFPFNGDTYGIGKRVFLHTAFQVTPSVQAFGYYTHEVAAERFPTLNLEGLNAGINFNLKALINAKKEVF